MSNSDATLLQELIELKARLLVLDNKMWNEPIKHERRMNKWAETHKKTAKRVDELQMALTSTSPA